MRLLFMIVVIAVVVALVTLYLKTINVLDKKDTKYKVITDKLVRLGAPTLPDGVDYVFVPDYDRNGGVQIKHVAAQSYSTIFLSGRTPEEALLTAARRAHRVFIPEYNEFLKKERLREVIDGEDKTVIGEKRPWQEDN